MNFNERVWLKDLAQKVGEEVSLFGWVNVRRDHGKLIFFDLRDGTGLVQVVALPDKLEIRQVAESLRPEWVIFVRGVVSERPKNMVNPHEPNGEYEISASEIIVLNESLTPPFPLTEDSLGVDESLRLKYRFLDLRTKRLQTNIRKRDELITFFRRFMHQHGFVEIETPILIKGTPEGAREYLVPSRLESGKGYALPQSPQQFKQLSMVAGFERYFQIARCFRDEDTRGDRQPEFTQLDVEMSFVNQEMILQFTEAMFLAMVAEVFPEKKVLQTPFPRISYQEAIEKFGTDKPDLRQNKNDQNELAFAWILDFPLFEKDSAGNLTTAHHPFCAPKEEDRGKFLRGEDVLSIRASTYDLVLNGFELSSGSIRIHESAIQERVFELLGIDKEMIEKRFGHLLQAFKYGAPPHGGFAPGIDRILTILLNEPNIREVIAFPKTGEGKDLMMGAPDIIPPEDLKSLGLKRV